MINFLCDKINCSDWLMLLFGFLLSVLWSIFIFSLRPRLQIMLPIIGLDPQRHLKIPIKNKSLFFTANKVSIEVALLDADGNTSHFDIDFKDFILIPTACNPESIRYFKSFYPHQITAEIFELTIDNLIDSIQIENSMIRVRVHAFHEFTGLGKSFEQKFVHKNNEFKIK